MTGRGCVTAGLVVIALGLGGCGDDGPTSVDVKGMRLELPAGWDEANPRNDRTDELVYAAEGPEDDAGGSPALTLLEADADPRPLRTVARDIARQRTRVLKDGRPAGAEAVDVPGADEAWRVDTAFAADDRDGDPTPSRAIEVIARAGATDHRLTIGATDAALAGPDVEAIIASFRLDR